MSNTRIEKAKLRNKSASGATVFGDTAESRFLLRLICDSQPITADDVAEVNWQRLRRAEFAMPELHSQSESLPAGLLPHDTVQAAKECRLHQLSCNRRRLETIEVLAKRFHELGIRAAFIGMAAELVLFATDPKLLSTLFVDDIDVWCSERDLHTLESLLLSSSYRKIAHSQHLRVGASHWTLESAKQANDSKINLYTQVNAERNFLPCVVSSLTTQDNRQVRLSESDVLIPAPNAMVAHALHQSAERTTQARKIQIDSFALHSFSHPIDITTLPDILNRQMDLEQMSMLLRLRNLLTGLAGSVDFGKVAELLSAADSESLRATVSVASHYLGSACPLRQGVTVDFIEAQRQRRLHKLVQNSALNRFEQHIAQQASTTNLVKEGFKRRLRAFIPAPVRKLIRGRLTASPRNGGEL